jgi:hypothetical protein
MVVKKEKKQDTYNPMIQSVSILCNIMYISFIVYQILCRCTFYETPHTHNVSRNMQKYKYHKYNVYLSVLFVFLDKCKKTQRRN